MDNYLLAQLYVSMSQNVEIRFTDQTFLTLQLDQDYPRSCPQISVSAQLLTRKQNQVFVVHFLLVGDHARVGG